MQTKIDPSVPSQEYSELIESMRLPKTLMGGTKAMRAAGETFMPQEERESDKDYKARLARSFLFGGFERTISILSGEVFDKPVTMLDDTPGAIMDLSLNIDKAHNNITRFTKSFFEQAIISGSGHILVDIDPAPIGEGGTPIKTNAGQDKKLGRRPYFKHVPAGDMLECRVDSNNEIYRARIKEIVFEDDGEFGGDVVEQIRVLRPGHWEVWRQDKKKDWFIYSFGQSPLTRVSIASLYTGKKMSTFTAKPPLTGLAELNQQHWVSSSDQNNILHVCRVPMKFGVCLNREENGEIIVSPGNLLTTENPDGKLTVVEHSGKAMADGWKDMERIETLMSLWGLDLISNNRSGDVTATEKAMNTAKTGSFLNSVAIDCQDCLNTALGFMSDMLHVEHTGGAVINTDFSLALSNFTSSMLVTAFDKRILDRATVIDELKRRGDIGEKVDPVEVAAALQNEGSSFGNIGASFLA